MPRMLKRSVTLAGHRTSISLEKEFWDALQAIRAERGTSLNDLIFEIDQARASKEYDVGLSSAVRVYVLRHLQAAAESSS